MDGGIQVVYLEPMLDGWAEGCPAMPQYFFHVFQGTYLSRDEEGDDFPDLGTAIQEAAHIARELLDDDGRPNDADFRMEVADERGRLVHVIRSQDVAVQ
jgi:hypothetical protein